MSNKLKEVTYLTIKNLKTKDIILPSTYSEQFDSYAKNLEIDYEKEDVILKDLYFDVDHAENIINKASNNLDDIYKSTKKAQIAIGNKDETMLSVANNELGRLQEQIKSLKIELFADPLTGAYNRKWLMDSYLKEDLFQNDGEMAFIDLNKFKIINDTYGHIVGDQVLKYLVHFLKKTFSKYEGINVARYAGDEFIILFTHDIEKKFNASKLMLETQERLSKQKLKSKTIEALSFGFSFGLVEFRKFDNLTTSLVEADKLMYQNKKLSK